MGIQINGQTDTVSTTTVGGKVTIPTATFPSVSNINVTGVSTFSGGIVVSSGSTAAPSISPSGDSNTGIFFPSPDTVAIGEGGNEALRVDSSGNVGIGTNVSTSKLTVRGRGDFGGGTFNTDFALGVGAQAETYYPTGAISNKNLYANAGTLITIVSNSNSVNSGCLIDFNAYNSNNDATGIYLGAASGSTQNGPANFVLGRRTGTQSWTESLRVDTSGNLGLGTINPLGQLAINSGSNPVILGTSTNVQSYNYTKTQYTALSASATFDVFRFLTNAGTVLSNNFAIGHFYVYAQISGGNSFAGVYAVATNGNGTAQTALTAVTTVTRGTSPVSTIQLANDGTNGAVKLQITTNANTGALYYTQVTFIGQVY